MTRAAGRKADFREGWITGSALAYAAADEFGRRKLRLRLQEIKRAAPPEDLILDGRHA